LVEQLEDRTVPTVMAMGDSFSAVHDHAITGVNVLTNDMGSSLTASIVSAPVP
jgi:hypothetical protein